VEAGVLKPESKRGLRADDQPLVRRVLASRLFERSPRTRQLFEFLCEQAGAAGPEALHEQEIGRRVFGRPETYDTAQDNIVRVQVSLLRKRLKTYFETEGSLESCSIEIPAGAYMPVVIEREPTAEHQEIVAPPPAVPERPTRAFNGTKILGIAVVVLAVACIILLVLLIRGGTIHKVPVADGLWPQLFSANQPTDIVVADSNVALVQDLTGRQLTLAEYLSGQYLRWADQYPARSEMRAVLSQTAGRPHTSLADAILVREAIAHAPDPKHVSVFLARNFSGRQLSTDNVILLGSKKSNPWLEVFEGRLNWRFRASPVTGHELLVSQDQGVQNTFNASPASGGVDTGYCQIALLPSPGGSGRVLIIAGTNAIASEDGGHLAGPEGDSRIRQALSIPPSGSIPCFEILVRTRHVGGAPGGYEVIYSRLLR
jgi:hypothetical protein